MTLVAVVDDEPCTVHVRLRGDDYGAAVRAHGADQQVRLIGDLQRRGDRAHEYDLLNATIVAAGF